MPRMVTCGAFDSTQKESTTPKGVASTSHLSPGVASYRRQPRAIECTTPMELPYHHPLIITPQREDEDNIVVELRPLLPIYYHTTTRRWCMTWHLSSRHNAGYNHTIPMGLRHHTPLLSHHNAEGDHTIPMGLRHHSPLLSHHNAEGDYTILMGLRHHTPLLLHHNAEGEHTIPWSCATTVLYYHIITWRMIILFRWGCATTVLYYHIITWRVTIPFRWGKARHQW